MTETNGKRQSATLKTFHAVTLLACTIGFTYGVIESWLKFQEQPLSSKTVEIGMEQEVLPSITLCRVNMDVYNKINVTNMTLEELRSEMGMELVTMQQG